MEKICKDCHEPKNSKDYYGVQNDCKECYKKRVRSQKERLGIQRKCGECNKNFKALASEINRGGGIVCSRECFFIRFKRIVKKGEASPSWKGDNVGYHALHDWVKKHLGRPKYCEFCKSTVAKTYEWANKSGQYKRDLSDWYRLCRKCHSAYDNMPTTRKATMLKKYGHFDPNKFKKEQL